MYPVTLWWMPTNTGSTAVYYDTISVKESWTISSWYCSTSYISSDSFSISDISTTSVCWVSMVNIPPPSTLSATQHTIYPTLMSAPALPKWWVYGEADSYHFLRLCPSKPSESRPFSVGIFNATRYSFDTGDSHTVSCKKARSVLTWEPLLYQRVDMVCDECHSREIPGLWLTDNLYASTLLPLPVNIWWLHTAQT